MTSHSTVRISTSQKKYASFLNKTPSHRPTQCSPTNRSLDTTFQDQSHRLISPPANPRPWVPTPPPKHSADRRLQASRCMPGLWGIREWIRTLIISLVPFNANKSTVHVETALSRFLQLLSREAEMTLALLNKFVEEV